MQGCSHALKLRHSFKLDAKTRMEIGLDLDVRLLPSLPFQHIVWSSAVALWVPVRGCCRGHAK